VAATVVLLTACSSPDPEAADTSPPTPSDESRATTASDDAARRFPDVVDAELERDGDAWRLSATLSSPYDSPERYADAFRARTEDGTVLGVRELLHDHANEQPFTRSLDGLEIPDDVERIVVEGRDLEHGWGGETVTVDVPR
jgi:hypothetical protein